MDLGLALPQYPFSVPGEAPLEWETTVRWARLAESLGFASVFLSDHLSFSTEKYGGPPEETQPFEPVVALGALARSTTRISVGTLALCEPLRPPAVLGKSLATLDRLAPGRVIVGVGAGWSELDFQAIGLATPPLRDRVERLREAIAVVSRMWTGQPASFDGVFHRVAGAVSRPAPSSPPPIWVCGGADLVVDLAAQVGDGWNAAWRWTPAGYAAKVARFNDVCEQAGRDPSRIHRSVGLHALVGESESDLSARYERLRDSAPAGVLRGVSLDDFRQDRLVGTVEQVQEQLVGWEQMGVATVVVVAGGVPFSVTIPDDLEMLASALPQE